MKFSNEKELNNYCFLNNYLFVVTYFLFYESQITLLPIQSINREIHNYKTKTKPVIQSIVE